MTHAQVAIVGGGLAGLHAARLLRVAGADFVLIEARDRLGGRILTADETGAPCEDGFDLGPSWYWPDMQPAIGELVAALDLPAFGQYSAGDVVFERMPGEGLRRHQGFAQEQWSKRLAGGTATLVRALAQGLSPDRLLLGTRVTAMALAGNGVTLTMARADGNATTIAASQVIAALPPRLIEATMLFTPAQDAATARRWRDAPTWMASQAKFVALYGRPFWREAGLSGTVQSMVGPMVEMHDATTSSGRAALFGFLGVAAGQRAAIGDKPLAHACLDQLARIFGEAARTPIATIFKDWAADPLTATALDQASAGHMVPSDAPWVLEPWKHRLALAGSETSPSDPGYLAGAIVAAGLAVEDVLTKLRRAADQG